MEAAYLKVYGKRGADTTLIDLHGFR